MTHFRPTATLLALALTLMLGACGLKADPRAPELVAPAAISNLEAKDTTKGVELRWSRPKAYANGDRMDDLGGFIVFRGLPGARAVEIGRVEVADHERFQKEKRFSFVDEKARAGQSYYYRIVSFTLDDYYGAPSNQVDVTTRKSR